MGGGRWRNAPLPQGFDPLPTPAWRLVCYNFLFLFDYFENTTQISQFSWQSYPDNDWTKMKEIKIFDENFTNLKEKLLNKTEL